LGEEEIGIQSAAPTIGVVHTGDPSEPLIEAFAEDLPFLGHHPAGVIVLADDDRQGNGEVADQLMIVASLIAGNILQRDRIEIGLQYIAEMVEFIVCRGLHRHVHGPDSPCLLCQQAVVINMRIVVIESGV
jgi:hypothetical protein